MNEDKATRYHRLGRRAGSFRRSGPAVILVGLLFSGVSVGLRDWAAIIAGANPALVVALYVLVLSRRCSMSRRCRSASIAGFCSSGAMACRPRRWRHWLKDHAKAVLIGVLFAERAARVRVLRASALAGVMVGDRRRRLFAGHGRAREPRAGGAAAAVLHVQAARRRTTLRDRLTALASKAGTRIMGVYEWTLSDRTKKANAALTGHGPHAAHSSLGHAARGVFRRRDRSDPGARARAPRAPGHLDVGRLRHGADVRGVLRRAPSCCSGPCRCSGCDGIADPAGMPVLLLTAGAIGAVREAADECGLALARTARRFVRAADDAAIRRRSSPR